MVELFDSLSAAGPVLRIIVISGVMIEPTGVNVHVKFGDSRSNRSPDVRLPYFVTNDDHDAGVRWSSPKSKMPCVLSKNNTPFRRD